LIFVHFKINGEIVQINNIYFKSVSYLFSRFVAKSL